MSSAVLILPENFLSPGSGPSGLNRSRVVSFHTNLPGIAGSNAIYSVPVHKFSESAGTTLRENVNSSTEVCGTMPDGSFEVMRNALRSNREHEVNRRARTARRRRVDRFMD